MNSYKKEVNMYMLFRQVSVCNLTTCVYICEYYIANPKTVSLEGVLSFFTGATRFPIGGFDRDA